jgi:hypothetical protein
MIKTLAAHRPASENRIERINQKHAAALKQNDKAVTNKSDFGFTE